MAKGSRIQATDFNQAQSIVTSVLGVGSGSSGYGMPVTSAQAIVGRVISASQWAALRADLVAARQHQINETIGTGAASIPANRGAPYKNLQIISSSTVISEEIRDQYVQFARGPDGTGGILGDKDVVAPGQFTPNVSLVSASRSTAWNASKSHTVTVTFPGYNNGQTAISADDHLRLFFNAGGKINISASRAGAAATTKDTDWSNMLGLAVKLGKSSTTYTGSLYGVGSVATSTGAGTLTASSVTLATQASSITQYAENRYTITVRKPTANTLEFVITFSDNDTGDQTGLGAAVDENITGTLTSSVTCDRPSGSSVDIPAPTAVSNNATLA
jgi:hypothetical protein